MSLRVRLLLIYAGIAAGLLISVLYLRGLLHADIEESQRLLMDSQAAQHYADAHIAFARYRVAVARCNAVVVLREDSTNQEACRNLIQQRHQALAATAETLRTHDRELAERLRGLLPADTDPTSHLQDLDPAQSRRELAQMRALFDPVDEQLQQAVAAGHARNTLGIARAMRSEKQRGNRALMVLAVALIAGSLLLALLMHSILRPLEAIRRALDQFSIDQPLPPLPIKRKDEFGAMARAIVQLRRQNERLSQQANTDTLTGLASRERLVEQLDRVIERVCKSNAAVATIFIGLNNFKAINDGFGHGFGDEYLRAIGARLRALVADDILVSRHAGDTFVLMVEGGTDLAAFRARAQQITEQLLHRLCEPLELRGQEIAVSARAGIALYPRDGVTTGDLLASADAALHQARRTPGISVQFAASGARTLARGRMSLAADIRRGMEEHEFEPFFEPIVDVVNGRVVAMESLLRWRHPQRGLVLPAEFLEMAEECGHLDRITAETLSATCEAAVSWPQHIKLSFNLSARQVRSGMVEMICAALARAKLPPTRLEVEITEGAIIERGQQAERMLRELRALGVGVCLDDFGTGYSSLSYLHRLPISKIKIDRSFIAALSGSRESEAITAAMIGLGGSLGLEVVAEGVETPAQMQRLIELGCHAMQGWLFTRALPADQLQGWLNRAALKAEDLLAAGDKT